MHTPYESDRRASRFAAIQRLGHEGEAGAGGALAGAVVGAIAGPPGILAGAVMGGIAGVVAGAVMDSEAARRSAHMRALDEEVDSSRGEASVAEFSSQFVPPSDPADRVLSHGTFAEDRSPGFGNANSTRTKRSLLLVDDEDDPPAVRPMALDRLEGQFLLDTGSPLWARPLRQSPPESECRSVGEDRYLSESAEVGRFWPLPLAPEGAADGPLPEVAVTDAREVAALIDSPSYPDPEATLPSPLAELLVARDEPKTRLPKEAWVLVPLFGVVVLWILMNTVGPTFAIPQLDPPPFHWLQAVLSLSTLGVVAVILTALRRRRGGGTPPD